MPEAAAQQFYEILIARSSERARIDRGKLPVLALGGVRVWRRAEVDAGKREGLTTDEREELKRLRAEVFELRRANSILKEASVYFARELDPNRPS